MSPTVADRPVIAPAREPAQAAPRCSICGDPVALTIGRDVTIDAGDHRGLCGTVDEIFRSHNDGKEWVSVKLQDGTYVPALRADVSPV